MTKPLKKSQDVIAKLLQDRKKILEIGSWLDPSQKDYGNLRPLYPKAKYIGTDMREGIGVDQVANANNLPFKDSTFDLVLCLETFEHADKPWQVAAEINRVVSKNGIIIVSSQQNFPIHSYPSDYFRYTPYGLKELFPNLAHSFVYTIAPSYDLQGQKNPVHVVLVGFKKENKSLQNKLIKALQQNQQNISLYKPLRHRLRDFVYFLKRAFFELNYNEDINIFK